MTVQARVWRDFGTREQPDWRRRDNDPLDAIEVPGVGPMTLIAAKLAPRIPGGIRVFGCAQRVGADDFYFTLRADRTGSPALILLESNDPTLTAPRWIALERELQKRWPEFVDSDTGGDAELEREIAAMAGEIAARKVADPEFSVDLQRAAETMDRFPETPTLVFGGAPDIRRDVVAALLAASRSLERSIRSLAADGLEDLPSLPGVFGFAVEPPRPDSNEAILVEIGADFALHVRKPKKAIQSGGVEGRRPVANAAVEDARSAPSRKEPKLDPATALRLGLERLDPLEPRASRYKSLTALLARAQKAHRDRPDARPFVDALFDDEPPPALSDAARRGGAAGAHGLDPASLWRAHMLAAQMLVLAKVQDAFQVEQADEILERFDIAPPDIQAEAVLLGFQDLRASEVAGALAPQIAVRLIASAASDMDARKEPLSPARARHCAAALRHMATRLEDLDDVVARKALAESEVVEIYSGIVSPTTLMRAARIKDVELMDVIRATSMTRRVAELAAVCNTGSARMRDAVLEARQSAGPGLRTLNAAGAAPQSSNESTQVRKSSPLTWLSRWYGKETG